jgi:Phage Mu protein F like protein
MLAAEGALLLLLLRRVRPLRGEVGELWTPEHLRVEVARDVLTGRRAAAEAGLDALVTEAAALGVAVPPAQIPWGLEVRRAEAAARGLADGLRRHLTLAAIEEADALAIDAVRWASSRAELTAATEAAHAFNEARDIAIGRIGRADPGLWFKQWDATLDRRTCDVCAHAHGTIVLADEDFPDGTPGQVHPRCRCVEHLLRRDEVSLDDYAGDRILL